VPPSNLFVCYFIFGCPLILSSLKVQSVQIFCLILFSKLPFCIYKLSLKGVAVLNFMVLSSLIRKVWNSFIIFSAMELQNSLLTYVFFVITDYSTLNVLVNLQN
jgi:hypothetical protein